MNQAARSFNRENNMSNSSREWPSGVVAFSVPADLVDLDLEVLDDLARHLDLAAEDLSEVDPLVAGYALVVGELDALLDVLDLGVPGDQVGRLGLLYGLVAEELAVLLLGSAEGYGHQAEQD